MKKIIPIVLVLLIILLASLSLQAENYVSSNGGFFITYPDDWQQIDYNTVDYFLQSNQAGRAAMNYEAVFALNSSAPFHKGPYIILSIDTVGEMSPPQIDSILNVLGEAFGEGIKYYPTGDYLTDLESQAPNYDAARKEITILNDITEQYKVVKKNLWIIKLYEKGLANFYFFSHDSSFAEYRPVLEKMLSSFSTENIDAARPKEMHKLADIDPAEVADETDSSSSFPIIPTSGVAMLIIIIAAASRRRRKKNSNS